MKRIELAGFTDYRFLSDLNSSPDLRSATFLAHSADLEKNGYRSDLWIWDGEQVRRITSCGDAGSPRWLSSEELIFSSLRDPEDQKLLSKGEALTAFYKVNVHNGGEARRIFSVPLRSAELVGMTGEGDWLVRAVQDLRREAALEGKTGEERSRVLECLQREEDHFTVLDEYPFWSNGRGFTSKRRNGVFLYNPETGILRRLTDKYFQVEVLHFDASQQKLIYSGCRFTTLRPYKTGLYTYDLKTGQETCLVPDGEFHIQEAAFFRGSPLFAGSPLDHHSVVQCPEIFLAGKTGNTVLCSAELSIGNTVVSDCRYGDGTTLRTSDEKIYFIAGVEDRSYLLSCDRDGQLESVLDPNGSVDDFDFAQDGFFTIAMSGMRLQELYLWKNGIPKQLTCFNEEIYAGDSWTSPQEIRFTNSDGTEIHGFVLRPAGFDPGQRYPAILDIHGGPKLSYGTVFCHEMQYWANHGYFVFYCNPTGSAGRGEEFGYLCGKFGTVDFDDLMQFTDVVLERIPQIDPARVGVTGGSYGGFMTNWIIGHTDRFAAAASQRSISNFITMEGTSDGGVMFVGGQLLAQTHSDLEKVWRHSPLKYFQNVKTPTLFIHAEEDYRCWYVEALQMFTAIKLQGVETRLCLFRGENHELSRSEKPRNRIKRMEEITRWFDAYLASGAE